MADKSFADYVKDLMAVLPKVNGNPMMSVTSMTDENARYREDPFYISRQRQADQLALDEAERARLAAQSGAGMMASGNNRDSGGGVPLTQEQIDFLDRETPEERYARITGDWFGLKPMGMMMVDPIGTFLTYPKQKATPNLGIGQAKTPYQIWLENWEKTLPVETQVVRNIQKAQMESQQALANSGWNPEGTQYTSSYGTTTDSGSISSAESAGLSAARESYGYGSNADYYGD